MKQAVITSTIIVSTFLGTISIKVEPTLADYQNKNGDRELKLENSWKDSQTYNGLARDGIASSLTVDEIQNKQTQRTVYAYVIESSPSHFSAFPIPIKINAYSTPIQALRSVFNYIIFGFEDFEYNGNYYSSSIPQGTAVNSISISGNAVYIDFNRKVVSRANEGSWGRNILMQIIYNATTLNPNAKVWLRIDGELIEYFGGQIVLDQPLTRNSL